MNVIFKQELIKNKLLCLHSQDCGGLRDIAISCMCFMVQYLLKVDKTQGIYVKPFQTLIPFLLCDYTHLISALCNCLYLKEYFTYMMAVSS